MGFISSFQQNTNRSLSQFQDKLPRAPAPCLHASLSSLQDILTASPSSNSPLQFDTFHPLTFSTFYSLTTDKEPVLNGKDIIDRKRYKDAILENVALACTSQTFSPLGKGGLGSGNKAGIGVCLGRGSSTWERMGTVLQCFQVTPAKDTCYEKNGKLNCKPSGFISQNENSWGGLCCKLFSVYTKPNLLILKNTIKQKKQKQCHRRS